MKKLVLIRHAKSDWSNPFLDDYLRPLNKRGKKNAPLIAKLLKEKNIRPDLIISSPSIRTKQTLEYFIKELNYNDEVKLEESIYEAPYENLLKVIKDIPNIHKIVFLIGHNPGLCDLTNFLVDKNFENIPTSSMVEIDFYVKNWKDISKENSNFISFEYPKKYI
ncbi:SixA phosphatase family protein [Aliarcobacter butzleri]|uniref:SixA phosphatase family protein n=1 Tax=Aliarcobacter butzleri TaxID=28197 RepID=UPI00214C98F9|nr:histidine phosphatase family protein [Aliarcobacter butzleri]MCP3648970.1 histidine phosphatase family protein [Arcobacter sp. DNRA7]MCR1815144.1 histidine phosphatase family protein [Aliarcobacter butzleri]